MSRVVSVLAAVVLVTTLAGCDSEKRDYIAEGKRCFDLGGSWEWNDWSGWKCEFKRAPAEGSEPDRV